MALHEFAEERLARAVGVDVGRVDEVAACFQKGIVDLAAFLLGRNADITKPRFSQIGFDVWKRTGARDTSGVERRQLILFIRIFYLVNLKLFSCLRRSFLLFFLENPCMCRQNHFDTFYFIDFRQ